MYVQNSYTGLLVTKQLQNYGKTWNFDKYSYWLVIWGFAVLLSITIENNNTEHLMGKGYYEWVHYSLNTVQYQKNDG